MNMFRREKAPPAPTPAVPPRPSKEDLDNPVEYSLESVAATGEVTCDPTPKRKGRMGVLDKVNPFKSTSQGPVGGAASSESPERGAGPSQSPGGLRGVMHKVNPFKSSSQAASPVSKAASSESLEHGAAATQRPGGLRGAMQKVNPFKSSSQVSEASSSESLEQRPLSDANQNPGMFKGMMQKVNPFKWSTQEQQSTGKEDSSAADGATETHEVGEDEGTALDPLDDEDGLVGWWRSVDGWDDWNEGKQSDDSEDVVEEAADRVFMAARLFVRLFNRRGAQLQQRILELMCAADAADAFHRKTVTASVGGGVASVAGSITTITGLILAPFTAGASLIVTAVGIAVATGGGVTSASANITDTVHSKTDRKKVEKIIQDYEEQMKDIRECLQFLQEGMELLEEWNFEEYAENISKKHLNQNVKHVMKEGGRAGKALVINTESLISTVQVLGAAGGAAKAAQVMSVTTGVMSGLFLALDLFFLAKDAKELKEGAKTQFATKIREVCKELQDGLLELNRIKEQLQATMDGSEVEEVAEEVEEDVETLKAELKQLVEYE